MSSAKQSFEEIKAECLRSGTLFEDTEFDAVDGSIFSAGQQPRKPFEWLRPTEITDNPVLFESGASREDVVQGELGNCWFLAALCSLTQETRLLNRVIPCQGQGYDKDNYCGAFHFKFWQDGVWVEVVVDDRLPTIYGKLVFVHSNERCEFWSALMEKAYAKLFGSYELLMGGHTCEAMEDFTGGVTESFELGSKAPQDLFQICYEAFQRGSLMCCSIDADPNDAEAELETGLIMGHAYSMTAIRKVRILNEESVSSDFDDFVHLVRIRNPWGDASMWRGSWSDRSSEWRSLSRETMLEMDITFNNNGEFWMSLEDFITNFQRLEICMLTPNPEPFVRQTKTWEVAEYKNKWSRGITSGGCPNNPKSFHSNPQFRVTLYLDDDDECCRIIISLMQIGRRKTLSNNYNHNIGVTIYKLNEKDQKKTFLDKDYFLRHRFPFT